MRFSFSDTMATLANSANYALEKLGLPTYPTEVLRPMLGGGTKKLMERALTHARGGIAPDAELLERASVLKMDYENSPTGQNMKVPFPYALDMLLKLQDAGVQLAVLSNTVETNVRKLVAKHFSAIRWKHVAGARDDTPLKPNPFAALRIQSKYMMNVEPKDMVFIGDSEFDMKTGKSAGMTPIAVPWGIRSTEALVQNGAAVVAGTMDDIASFIIGADAIMLSKDFRFI